MIWGLRHAVGGRGGAVVRNGRDPPGHSELSVEVDSMLMSLWGLSVVLAPVWPETRQPSPEWSVIALVCKLHFFPTNPTLSSLGINTSGQNFSLFLAKNIPTKERKECGEIHSRGEAGQRTHRCLSVRVPGPAARPVAATWIPPRRPKHPQF